MRKDELIADNERLKKDLNNVCEHHLRLTKILNNKIDENAKLKEQLRNAKKVKSQRKRSI